MPSEREGPCRAMVNRSVAWNQLTGACARPKDHPMHGTAPYMISQHEHPYTPRPTLREWLRDAALWLAPPGWVIGIGLLASIVALALLLFDAVPR